VTGYEVIIVDVTTLVVVVGTYKSLTHEYEKAAQKQHCGQHSGVAKQ
jgi:hypothetical protein